MFLKRVVQESGLNVKSLFRSYTHVAGTTPEKGPGTSGPAPSEQIEHAVAAQIAAICRYSQRELGNRDYAP